MKERWRIDARWGNRWEVVADIENGNIAYTKPWLPANVPTPSAGSISGKLRLSGSGAKLLAADADLRLVRLAFSDASGLHAGEKISGKITLKARQERGTWPGRARCNGIREKSTGTRFISAAVVCSLSPADTTVHSISNWREAC